MRLTKFYFALLVLFFGFMLPNAEAWNTPQSNHLGSSYQPWTWTGKGLDTNWNNGNNWCGAYLSGECRGQSGGPPSTALVIFDSSCQQYSNCNPVLPGGTVPLRGIVMKSTYTGTINQASTNLTLGTAGFEQYGGTFVGGPGTITVVSGTSKVSWNMTGGTFVGGAGDISVGNGAESSSFVLSGGNFTAPTGTLRLMTDVVNFNGVTFAHQNGTVEFEPTANNMVLSPSLTVSLNNVRFVGSTSRRLQFNPVSTSLYVAGTATVAPSGYGITLNSGNVVMQNGSVYHTGAAVMGDTIFRLIGNTQQNIDSSGATDPYFVGVELAHPSVSGSGRFVGDIKLAGSFLTASTLGTFDLNGAAVSFSATFSGRTYDTTFIQFPSLLIDGPANYMSFGTVRVLGDLTISPVSTGVNSSCAGVVYVGGNVVIGGSYTFGHCVQLELIGGSSQQVTYSGTSRTSPGLTFNNSGGGVTFGESAVTIAGGLRLTSGNVTLPTNVNFGSNVPGFIDMPTTHPFTNLTLAKSSTFTLQQNVLVNGNLQINNSSESYMNGSFRIMVKGNFFNGSGATSGGYFANSGSPVIELSGTIQTIDFTATTGTRIPSLDIRSSVSCEILGSMILKQANFVNSSPNVSASTSTLMFTSSNSHSITPGGMEFGLVRLEGRNITVSGGPLIVRTGLVLDASNSTNRALTGSVRSYGYVSITNVAMNGSATIDFLGNNSSFRSDGSVSPSGTLTVNKAAGQVLSLSSNVTLNSGQNLNVVSGQIDLAAAGRTLTLTGSGALNLSAGTSVKLSGGTLTVGGSVIPVGPYGAGEIVP